MVSVMGWKIFVNCGVRGSDEHILVLGHVDWVLGSCNWGLLGGYNCGLISCWGTVHCG
jgi:hypothetical protein